MRTGPGFELAAEQHDSLAHADQSPSAAVSSPAITPLVPGEPVVR
jgi:hypothetical protein